MTSVLASLAPRSGTYPGNHKFGGLRWRAKKEADLTARLLPSMLSDRGR